MGMEFFGLHMLLYQPNMTGGWKGGSCRTVMILCYRLEDDWTWPCVTRYKAIEGQAKFTADQLGFILCWVLRFGGSKLYREIILTKSFFYTRPMLVIYTECQIEVIDRSSRLYRFITYSGCCES
jgi:hypothetical protein